MEIKIIRYNAAHKKLWNNFVTKHEFPFLFYRDFIEYHGDKFEDHSLLLFIKEKLAVIFPAHQYKDSIYSHNGLSFGGFLPDAALGNASIFNLYKNLLFYYKQAGFSYCFYKKMPLFYTKKLAQHDDFFLFKSNASLESREMNLVIPLQNQPKLQARKYRSLKKSENAQLKVLESYSWEAFWQILTYNLRQRHAVSPVHSITEIQKLANVFPKNIRLFVVMKAGEIIAGTVLFINQQVIHCQYIAATEKGRNLGALDFLFYYLINNFNQFPYFSLGVSSLRKNNQVNSGLIEWKEGFGALPFSHDFYKIDFTNLHFPNQVFT
ncbi:MAG: GNAT family N-acetyltransferase [Bacteroidota bacterium]